jgi:hypothetical protein
MEHKDQVYPHYGKSQFLIGKLTKNVHGGDSSLLYTGYNPQSTGVMW